MTREETPDETDDVALRWEGDEAVGRDSVHVEFLDADDTDDAANDASHAAVDASDRTAPGASTEHPLPKWLVAALALVSAVGWLVFIVQNPVSQPSLLGLIMYQLGEFVAMIAPIVAWAVVDRVVRGSRRRLAWWLVALVVTAPWPLIVRWLA